MRSFLPAVLAVLFSAGLAVAADLPKPGTADRPDRKEAAKHLTYPDVANFYLMKSNRDKDGMELVVEVNGELLSVLATGQFVNTKFEPGSHEFIVSKIDPRDRNNPGALRELSRFEIDMSANTRLFIICGTNFYFYDDEDAGGSRELMPRSHCAAGNWTNVSGTNACTRQFTRVADNQRDMCFIRDRGRNYPRNFDHALWGIDQGRAQMSLVPAVDRRAETFQAATETGTADAFRAFLGRYPAGQFSDEARARIQTLEGLETKQQLQDRISATLARDARLPLSAKKDKYTLVLTRHLERQEYEDSLFYFELLQFMRVEQPALFDFYWGEALLRSGQSEAAIDKLYAFINQVDATDPFYERALELTLEAEAVL